MWFVPKFLKCAIVKRNLYLKCLFYLNTIVWRIWKLANNMLFKGKCLTFKTERVLCFERLKWSLSCRIKTKSRVTSGNFHFHGRSPHSTKYNCKHPNMKGNNWLRLHIVSERVIVILITILECETYGFVVISLMK